MTIELTNDEIVAILRMCKEPLAYFAALVSNARCSDYSRSQYNLYKSLTQKLSSE